MKKIVLITMLLVMALVLSGWTFGLGIITGSNETINVEIENPPEKFSSVNVSYSINAQIIKSDYYDIKITSNKNLAKYIIVKEKDGELILKLRGFFTKFLNIDINADIFMPDLEQVVSSTSARVSVFGFDTLESIYADASTSSHIVLGTMNAANAEIRSSTSGEVEGTITSGDTISINNSSHGIVTLAGNADILNVEGSTSAVSNLADLPVSDADIKLSTSAKAYVRVSDNLSVNLSTSSICYYTENPTLNKVELSTSGRLENNN